MVTKQWLAFSLLSTSCSPPGCLAPDTQLQGWDEVRIYDNTQPHDQTPSITTTLKKTYGEDLLAARITVENIRTRVVGGQVCHQG